MIKIEEQSLKNYTFIDLFAGLGGFRLALESLGAKCVYSNEWDKYAQEVYSKNFGDIPDGDITKVNENNIPNHDILCAGFPCQAFSISGKQLGFNDSRGTLFFDVARIVKCKRPKIVFMENVKNFATHDSGKTLQVVKATMEELGYTFNYKVLNATNFGIPQKRERIYMVCFRNDLGINKFSFPKPIELVNHVEDLLLKDESILNDLYVNREDTYYTGQKDNMYSNKCIRLGIVNKGGQGERIYSTKGIAITLSANGGGIFAKTGGYLVNGKPRKLHQRECARLMGFPDSYIFSENKNQVYKQLGNSVVVDVLQYIAIEIGKKMLEADFAVWLQNINISKKVANDYISRIKNFEQSISNCNITNEYFKDRCSSILSLFNQTGLNEEMVSRHKGSLPLGKYYLSTYKLAIKKYVNFMDEYYSKI